MLSVSLDIDNAWQGPQLALACCKHPVLVAASGMPLLARGGNRSSTGCRTFIGVSCHHWRVSSDSGVRACRVGSVYQRLVCRFLGSPSPLGRSSRHRREDSSIPSFSSRNASPHFYPPVCQTRVTSPFLQHDLFLRTRSRLSSTVQSQALTPYIPRGQYRPRHVNEIIIGSFSDKNER